MFWPYFWLIENIVAMVDILRYKTNKTKDRDTLIFIMGGNNLG